MGHKQSKPVHSTKNEIGQCNEALKCLKYTVLVISIQFKNDLSFKDCTVENLIDVHLCTSS